MQLRHLYDFGPYRVDASERVLRCGNEVVPLAPKAFELLLALVENSGHVVTKDQLMKRIWPDTFVEEANLSHNIYKLREALSAGHNGEKYIETVPRRGYRFVAQVTATREDTADLLVTEHTRTHILIEEETNEPPAPVGFATHPRTASLALPRLGWNRLRTAVALLIALVVVLAGGTGLAYRRGWFSRAPQRNEVHGPAVAGEMKITRVTNSGKVGASSVSPDGKFITYFENYTSGKGTMYVRQTGSNNEIQLLEPGERFFGGAAFSPDSMQIYYVSYEKNDRGGALYRIPVLGGPPTRLIGDFDSMFTLSPDGRQVAFYRREAEGKQKSIIIASLESGEQRTLLSRATAETILSGIPAWSPDGSLIAFGAAQAMEDDQKDGATFLFAAQVASGEVRQLSNERYVEIGKMNWTPDGKGLIYVALRPREGNQFYYLSYPETAVHRITNDLLTYGNYGLGITNDQHAMVVDIWESTSQLWIIGADGKTGDARQLTLGNDDGAQGLSALADGRMAYVARTGDEYDIWTANADGTGAQPLTADVFSQGRMSSTPDGRYLVFTSDRAGGHHLFRLNTDGSQLTQLTFGSAYDGAPDCSPDSKWVVYESSSAGLTTLWKVPVEGGSPTRLTEYEATQPSYSPDGTMIASVLPAQRKTIPGSIALLSAGGGPPLKTFDSLVFPFANGALWTPDGQAIVFPKTENHILNLWLQPTGGGPPRALTNFTSDSIFKYAYTRDGKSIILARGKVVVNVAMITNFRKSEANDIRAAN
ncbi:MAG: winged helix-turn-helix domain-containing protein [Pyrinomonadaceae bacterium]